MLESKPIFYVDDDVDDLEIFFEVATSLGIEAKIFNRGDELLHTLLNPPPKPLVVFVDLNMPRISGFEVMQQIKNNDFLSDIPVIVFSTAHDCVTVEKCKKLGANYYIKKPSLIGDLKRTLQHVVATDWNEHDSSKNFFHKFP